MERWNKLRFNSKTIEIGFSIHRRKHIQPPSFQNSWILLKSGDSRNSFPLQDTNPMIQDAWIIWFTMNMIKSPEFIWLNPHSPNCYLECFVLLLVYLFSLFLQRITSIYLYKRFSSFATENRPENINIYANSHYSFGYRVFSKR